MDSLGDVLHCEADSALFYTRLPYLLPYIVVIFQSLIHISFRIGERRFTIPYLTESQ
jgi:hypothetical protein